ncbi:MAG TPA: OmpA family protein, partial [Steroidobacteraceae bacterium]|nr:OmpA family protein [Steroidobacteraceae bacterium]
TMERTMADSIMDAVLAMVSPEMQQSLAARLAESPQSVYRGLGTAAAATLDGMASKAGDPLFITGTLNLVNGSPAAEISAKLAFIASKAPDGTSADPVNRLLGMVFGSQQSQVARAIAQEHGLKISSAMELLRMAVPLLLAWLARAQSAGTLDGKAFAGMLRAEAPQLRGYLPSALLGSAAGVVRSTVRETASESASDGAEPVVPPRWLAPAAIAAALVVAGLGIRALTLPKEPAAPVATVTAEATNTGETSASNAAIEAATAAWTALGDMMNVKLPDGSELSVPSLGVEARLVQFLNDGPATVANTAWFDFDRLLFTSGKATLQSASQEQLTNIAAILKAYPQVRIRIGGYTDNNGDPGTNLRLSEERANTVMDELVKLGIDPARMSARGYGEHNPIADNSTEDGRQKNRRISLRVTDQQAAV